MLIDCPGCARSYHVTRATLGAAGREVVCPRCDARWFVAAEGHGVPIPGDFVDRVPELRAEAVSERVQLPSYEDVYGRTASVPARGSPSRLPRPPRSLALGAAALTLMMVAIGSRAQMVRAFPRANAIYAALGLPVNLRGVVFRSVRSRRDDDGRGPVLAVEGEIANVRDRATKVPEIRLSLRDGKGAEIYSWMSATPKLKLDPGETVAFRATLASPPPGAADVLVRFASAASASDKRPAR